MTDAGAPTADACVMVSFGAKPDMQSRVVENPDPEVSRGTRTAQRPSVLSGLDGARAGGVGGVDPASESSQAPASHASLESPSRACRPKLSPRPDLDRR